MHTVYFSLGSNMGDRFHYLKQAVHLLSQVQAIRLEKFSAVYETEPVGYVDQAPFLNMVVAGATSLSPTQLLSETLAVEERLCRERNLRWGPRTIDIDILLYGEEVIQQEQLQIPHPRMTERAFVLMPLVEIARECLIPVSNNKYIAASECLAKIEDKSGVVKWMNFN